MPARPLAGPHLVAAFVPEPLSPFELSVAAEVFGLPRPELGVEWYDFAVFAERPGVVRTKTGFSVVVDHGLEVLRRAGTVVVPGWDHRVAPSPALVAALRRAHHRGARVLSFCSGAFLLAAAGLLDGRRATTHWMYAETLAALHPEVDVDPRVLYVDDGDVMTSAGTAAGIDLCLHLVRQDHGADVANRVARRMVVPPHRDGGQAQFVDHPIPESDVDGPLQALLAWVVEHLDVPYTVDTLASRAHMSPRTFARRFRAATGTTPHRWILEQRLLLAQRLLETSDLPVERIAQEAGFGPAVNLRAHFQRWAGTSPLAYRRTFRAAAS